MTDSDATEREPQPAPAGEQVGPLARGTVLAGRYRIARLLGSGGMGHVYEARDSLVLEHVALKVLRTDVLHADQLERFRRELQLSRRITHENVCRVHDLGRDGAVRFLTMELLPGETLLARVRRGPVELAEALLLARQMAGALSAAHRAGVIHRDFKSANVMLVAEGEALRAVVTDFGLAREVEGDPGLTQSGALLGTPAYMAPEQVLRQPASAASDVYSLGMVLYELVAGVLPLAEEGAARGALRRLSEPIPSPRQRRTELDRGSESAILACLALRPGDRATAAEVVEMLAGGRGRVRAAPRLRRRTTIAALFAAAALAAGGAAISALASGGGGERATQPARPRSVTIAAIRDLSPRAGSSSAATVAELLRSELAASGLLLSARREAGGLELVGSYLAVGPPGRGQIRLDLRVRDPENGDNLAVVSESGREDELRQVVARAAGRLVANLAERND